MGIFLLLSGITKKKKAANVIDATIPVTSYNDVANPTVDYNDPFITNNIGDTSDSVATYSSEMTGNNSIPYTPGMAENDSIPYNNSEDTASNPFRLKD